MFYGIVCTLACTAILGEAHAHTLDSMEGYRLEIGWMNSPPYSGEVNAIVLHISPMMPGLELEEQPFRDGVAGLRDTLKMQLVSATSSLTLRLDPDPDIPGKYYVFTKINRPGFYQANLIGTINDANINISMHPPQVRNAEHITFPQEYGMIYDVVATQDMLQERLDNITLSHQAEFEEIRQEIDIQEQPVEPTLPYVIAGIGVVMGAVAMGMAAKTYRRLG